MERFGCGLYGGSFNPLHLGHVRCMIEAANRCRELIVVISAGTRRDEIPLAQRYRWVYEAVKHFPHVRLMTLTDDAPTKADYTGDRWLADAEKVKRFAGRPIDAVFFGSDYGPDCWWTRCYPEAVPVRIERDGISSTAIRANPLACWDMLPLQVRPWYAKRVLLIGGESCGKSTLAASLAQHYGTVMLEEVGREISERSGTDRWMIPSDFTDILLTHKLRETEALQRANRLLIEDTDCLTTLFFLRFLSGPEQAGNAALAEAVAGLNRYDLVLLLQPDVPFVQDGDRSEEIAANREHYSALLRASYEEHGFPVREIGGSYQERYAEAVRLIDRMMEGSV